VSELQTPVTDLLALRQVRYRILPHLTPAVSIEDAARQRNISPRQMVKSILLRDMGGNFALACVPGDCAADPKKVRALLQCRRMTCVSLSEVEQVTGYQPGTVTPLQLKTEMPVIFDMQFKQMQQVTISSGSNMAGLMLDLDDLIALCNPEFAHICRDK